MKTALSPHVSQAYYVASGARSVHARELGIKSFGQPTDKTNYVDLKNSTDVTSSDGLM